MASTSTGVTVGVWLLAVLCASVWALLDSTLDEPWEQWKTTHQKKYNNEVEELGRRALWEKNLNHVNHHNLEASLGLHTYTLGINHLSDLTEDEMLQIVAPLKLPEDFEITPTPLEETNVTVTASLDWRRSGYVTSVKHQGYVCGSCWAFSAAGALEGLWAKTKGKLVDLSPQNQVDCTFQYGNFGCKGGWPHHSFQYVIKNKGIQSEASYPYEAEDRSCRYNPKYSAATCSRYRFVPKDERSLQQAVAAIGPISVLMDARTISYYRSGVYFNRNCGQEQNHAVLLVGYGTDRATGLDYWLIKNSWGSGWGESGYMRLARNKNKMCGISEYAVYPQ